MYSSTYFEWEKEKTRQKSEINKCDEKEEISENKMEKKINIYL